MCDFNKSNLFWAVARLQPVRSPAFGFNSGKIMTRRSASGARRKHVGSPPEARQEPARSAPAFLRRVFGFRLCGYAKNAPVARRSRAGVSSTRYRRASGGLPTRFRRAPDALRRVIISPENKPKCPMASKIGPKMCMGARWPVK